MATVFAKDFSPSWISSWGVTSTKSFGWANLTLVTDPEFGSVLRATYPAGSCSSSYAAETGAPVGGGQFLVKLPAADSYTLSYYVRFDPNFQWVKGGKLPGMYGGGDISGGDLPNGTNGLSTRYMWRAGGLGEMYGYVATSVDGTDGYGTDFGRGSWTFTAGTWHLLTQTIVLNTIGQSNGVATLSFDGKEVFSTSNILYRTAESLQINGIFFSTFFGGHDATWATPVTTYTDYAQFRVTT